MDRLTKSGFVQGIYCPALLWYLTHDRKSLPNPDPFALMMMEQGSMVGELATELFDGTLIQGYGTAAERLTKEAMQEHDAVFEATFIDDRLLCKVDVLKRSDDGWDIIEVKSSTRVKEEHLYDIAFQTNVLQKAGIEVGRSKLMHIDREYVRKGEVELERLFEIEDVTEEIELILETIEEDIEKLLAVMDGPRPELPVGPHCKNRDCPLDAITFKDLPEHNVTELYYNNGQAFIEDGIIAIDDLEEPVGLNPKQRIQWRAVKTGEPQINEKKLTKWLDDLEYPLIHLDFETINPAIPPFDNLRPYEHMPFQYSIHVEHEDGTVEHKEFLGDGKTDPRQTLLAQLKKDIPETGTVLAHNMSFERRVLEALGNAFDEQEWVQHVTARLADTITPFRSFWYYHPDQHGSCSIKYVLPALSGKSYDDLAIGDGTAAQIGYARLAEDISEEERKQLREDLLTYCGLDTEGMVDVVAALRSAAK